METIIIYLPDQTAQSNFSHHREYLVRTVLQQISSWYVLPSEIKIKILNKFSVFKYCAIKDINHILRLKIF